MRPLVYVSDWQIQCCGDEFAVGDEVTWPVAPVVRSDPHGEPLLGPELASALTGFYEAHDDEMPPKIVGTVSAIRTVACRWAPLDPPSDTLYPVAGTTVLEPVGAIEKWYGTDVDPLVLRFCGWLIDLEVDPSLRGGPATL